MDNVDKIRRLVQEVLSLPSPDIPTDLDLAEIGMSSLSVLDLFLRIESEFHLEGMEGEIGFENFRTIASIMACLRIEP